MKASLNGAPNCSVLDGWWPEAYNGRNGWAIGDEREYASQEEQDWNDAQSLYHLLEHEIAPASTTIVMRMGFRLSGYRFVRKPSLP